MIRRLLGTEGHDRVRRPFVRAGRGFTLLELTFVLLVSITLFGMMSSSFRLVEASKPRYAYDRMELLASAVHGGLSDEEGGFVGDIGRLPVALNSTELRTPDGMAAGGNLRGASYGWNGPYAGHWDRVVEDPWRRPFRLLPDGRLASNGPDGVPDNGDDIYLPANPPVGPFVNGVSGAASFIVLAEDGSALDNSQVTVTVYNPNPALEGALAAVPATWMGDHFVAASLSPARHTVKAEGAAGSGYEYQRAYADFVLRPGSRASVVLKLRRVIHASTDP